MQINVIKNARRNIVFGAANRIVLLLIPFVERTMVQVILGAQYLGLGSLFQSVISVLSLAELGFSSAMVYNMYKPVAEGNFAKINALLNYYRKVYRIIGLVILLIGSSIIPWLPNLIKGDCPADISITKLYLIYLINTSLSYFLFAYLNSVLVVNQREDVRSVVNSGVKIGLAAAQIALLLITRNYYLFTIMLPVFTIVNNLWLARRVGKLFPQYKAAGQIDDNDRKSIKKLVAGTFVQQACAVTRNSLDSVCISAFLGLTLTAIYNNYYVILNGITMFVAIYTASFTGGIGNRVATQSVRQNFEEMKKLDFVYLWIGGFCTVCLLCLYQPFMTLWMGEEMLMPFSAVMLLCTYFYLLKLGDVRSLYSSANGLWWEQRYRAIGETLTNLVLNITLGKYFGVHGIILATIISLFLCNYIWSVGITFRLYFSKSRQKEYYLYQGRLTLVMVTAAALTYWACSLVETANLIGTLAIRAVLCLIIPNALYYALLHNTEQFSYAKKKIFRINEND